MFFCNKNDVDQTRIFSVIDEVVTTRPLPRSLLSTLSY